MVLSASLLPALEHSKEVDKLLDKQLEDMQARIDHHIDRLISALEDTRSQLQVPVDLEMYSEKNILPLKTVDNINHSKLHKNIHLYD